MATLKESADAFVAKLSDLFGLVEKDLQVLPLRGSKQGPKTVGYYSKLSQFRSRCRVYVNVAYIESCYMHPSDADDEVRKTVAFGYAASMLEALEQLAKEGDPMVVPDWKGPFNSDSDLFAEDFARLCVTVDALQEPFWERFMLDYARVPPSVCCLRQRLSRASSSPQALFSEEGFSSPCCKRHPRNPNPH